MVGDDGPRLLKWPQVRARVDLGRTTVWRLRRADDFPDPVPISPRRVAWRECDITAWIERRGEPAARRPPPPPPGPPVRPAEVRVSARPAPATPAGREPDPPQRTPPRPVRRLRSRVAEGQLGFDF
jgi:predicted DNA-binding transcriptional regulator AlpA